MSRIRPLIGGRLEYCAMAVKSGSCCSEWTGARSVSVGELFVVCSPRERPWEVRITSVRP
ncbi:hypothetical protein [Streptomyces sp. S07_1.15]|uniref:hypothetical protein n=1 Tax=Streptomyces sp. S07_1.15 TaxID=2873925 RepID=UPI0035A8E90C